MKNKKSKLRTLFSMEGLKNFKNYIKTNDGKQTLKELGKSLKGFRDDMDVFK